MKALNRYLMHRPRDGDDRPWLADGGQPLQMRSIQIMVQRLKRRAGVSGGGAHRLRHYFATKYLEAGGNPSSLQLLLGHQSFTMVFHYARMVSAQKGVDEHLSPLSHLYHGGNHKRQNDGWGWHY